MRDLQAPGEQVADREGGAGHRPLDAQGPRRTAHERGLAAAELPTHEHDIPGRKPRCELGAYRLGLFGCGGLALHGSKVAVFPHGPGEPSR